MDKRVLILGASGLVGSALMGELGNRPGIDVVGTCYSNPKEDLVSLEMQSNHNINELIDKVRPNDIYIAAYMANVDKCETDGYTRVVNVDGVKSVVAAAKKVNARVVFFSSSYVFDGSKTDAYTVWDLPMPSQQYGLQKLMGEIAVLNSDKRNVVIRTVAVFGKEDKRKNFAYKIIDTLEQGNLVYVSLDQRVNPIHATKLASNSVNLVEDGFTGLVHIAGSDEVTKYDFALDIASSFQLNTDYVVGVMDKDIPHKATRPWNGCLAGCTENSYQSALETFYEQN